MRYSEKNTRLQSATKGDFIWNGPVETNNQTRRGYYYWTVNAVTRRWQLTQGDRRRGRRRKKQWHRDRASIFFGLSCYCFSSSFSFPRLRFPPHYVSQHIIGLSVCECVCVWSHGMESVVNPLVWPGTQGHLALSRSLSVSLSRLLSSPNFHQNDLEPSSPLFVCLFVGLFIWWPVVIKPQDLWAEPETFCWTHFAARHFLYQTFCFLMNYLIV